MIGWNFPESAMVKGIADAGIETFNGKEVESLARETCQNSLDAAIDKDNPDVTVEFFRYLVPSEQIPGFSDYSDAIKKCKIFWDKSKSEKAKLFLSRACKEIKENKTFVLRVSDYNTTGLANPYADEDSEYEFDGWNSLVKIDGGANKSDEEGGAFGIGKNAPFCNSHYRLVFYRTLNENEERAAQGMARILSFPVNIDATRPMTGGIGFYGATDGNMPIESISQLDELNIRNEKGTDVFVYGFNGPTLTGEWEREIIKAVLDSFLMSIYKGYLCVKIQNEIINSETMGRYFGRTEYQTGIKNSYYNYLVLSRSENVHVFERDFHGMGTIELKLLVSNEEKLDKKILIVRKTGMKLFRLGNLSKLVNFSGILELKGKELNKFFRAMETVSHDNWVPGRHPNPKKAKEYYDELKEWIRSQIAELAEYASDEEVDIKGLGGVLQNEPELVSDEETDSKRENLNNHLGSIEVLQRQITTTSRGMFFGQGTEGKNNREKTTGVLGKEGESGIRVLKGQRKRKQLEQHKGKPDEVGKDIVVKKMPGGEQSCPLKNVRIIKQGRGSYLFTFEVPHDVATGRIEIVTVGENGKVNKLRCINAVAVAGCSEAYNKRDIIAFSDMSSGEKIKIHVEMADVRDYAMEVNVYEHN